MIFPEKEKHYAEVEKLIHSCHIMTLGTTDIKSVWTAPVYYIYLNSGFYFFSKATSRHILHTEVSGKAAASIHNNPQGWADIQGVQMEGVVSRAGCGKKSRQAFSAYVKRFPFVHEIMGGSFSGSLEGFTEQFKVRWYIFVPEKMVYLDNSVGFGFRRQIPCNQHGWTKSSGHSHNEQ